ncbi:unnamed protein product [Laminaria digitata]
MAAFAEFEEAPIHFAPTYKYQPGTQVYEERPEKKRRAPAWCDRVLWRTRDEDHVASVLYSRADLVLSDHKPVCAELSVKIRQIERRERLRSFKDVTNQIRRVESTGSAPQLSLGASSVDLGDVYYRTVKSTVLRVANVGQGLAFVRFTPKLDEAGPFRRWLRVEPAFALLTPGERTEFKVSVFVDRLTAREICSGFEILEDTLVLRLEGGAEYYVPVFARYASQAFGTPLEQLSSKHGSQAGRLGIPIVLWRLVDAVIRGGALLDANDAAALFPPGQIAPPPDTPLDEQTAAVLRHVGFLLQCLDTGTEFAPSTPPVAFITALMALLSALPDPVIPVAAVAAVESELAAKVASAGGGGGGGGSGGQTAGGVWGQKFLRALSPAQHNTFLYVAGFLREVANAGRSAGLRPGPLASFACDALCFKDTPWLGSMVTNANNATNANTSTTTSSSTVGGGGHTGVNGTPWQYHREVFRAVLTSFVSATR